MKSSVRFLRKLAMLTQLLFSVAVPLVLFIVGGKWLTEHYALGKWVMLLCVLLGVLSAIAGLTNTVKAFLKDDSEQKKPPASFNNHE